MPGRLRKANKLVGAKQALKSLKNGQARVVYIARDADKHVTQPIIEQCKIGGVEVIEVETMAELGKACLIDVGAAVAVIID